MRHGYFLKLTGENRRPFSIGYMMKRPSSKHPSSAAYIYRMRSLCIMLYDTFVLLQAGSTNMKIFYEPGVKLNSHGVGGGAASFHNSESKSLFRTKGNAKTKLKELARNYSKEKSIIKGLILQQGSCN